MLLLSVPEAERDDWAEALAAACGPGVAIATDPATADPTAVRYIAFAPDGPVRDFSPFPGLRAVFSLWAGVERIAPNPTLTQPLCRMVDPGLAQGMVEYCAGWVLRAHLGMDRYAQDGIWRNDTVPPSMASDSIRLTPPVVLRNWLGGLTCSGRTASARVASRGRSLGFSSR